MSTPPPPPDALLAERIVARLLDGGLIASHHAPVVRDTLASGQPSKADWCEWIGAAPAPADTGAPAPAPPRPLDA